MSYRQEAEDRFFRRVQWAGMWLAVLSLAVLAWGVLAEMSAERAIEQRVKPECLK